MTWRAIVPVKLGGERKTRLAGALSPNARERLSDALLCHVVQTLMRTKDISEVAILAPSSPGHSGLRWIADEGRGLNEELRAAAMASTAPLLVIHADLPALLPADISALIGAGRLAIAPDRHDTGTNAIAFPAGAARHFAFGEGSFRRHLALLGTDPLILRRLGLALDIDTPDDVQFAAGHRCIKPALAALIAALTRAEPTSR